MWYAMGAIEDGSGIAAAPATPTLGKRKEHLCMD